MESHLIYKTHSYLKNLISWNEWIYCGVGDDIKEDVINNAVSDYFQDAIVYFISNRNESGEIIKQNISERIKKELKKNEVFVWEVNFKKVIEFNKIGVMRNGFVSTPV